MPARKYLTPVFCLLAVGGCSKEKSTAQLLADLQASQARDRVIAVRLLPLRQEDAAQIIPALVDALKDEEADVRMGAAWGLGTFGEQAKDATAALQQIARNDPDMRNRKAAIIALERIGAAR